jgi:hypothetical protein
VASVRRMNAKKKKASVPQAGRLGKQAVSSAKVIKLPLPRSVTIEPLNPWLICGPDTSVRELWRIVETVGRLRTFHLVFFDQYGWYCEHGRECAAVSDVRRLIKELGVTWTSDNTRIAKKTG